MSALLLTLSLTVTAAGDLDRALSRMTVTTGAQYLDARARVIDFGAAPLRTRTDAALWSPATWKTDAAAAAALLWIERPEACAEVYALDGLDPASYLQRRRPGPEVGRELRRMQNVGPILVEALTKSLHQLSSPSDFPEFSLEQAEQLIASEDAALRVGLLAALGRCGHPAATWVLTQVLRDTQAPEGERRAAAIALGEAGGNVTLLRALATDDELSPRLRAGAVIGVAKASRTDAHGSVDALRAFLTDPVLTRPAISGLAIAGASWGNAHDDLRSHIAVVLTSELGTSGQYEGALIEALTVVNHPITRVRLEALRRGPSPAVRSRAERALLRVTPATP